MIVIGKPFCDKFAEWYFKMSTISSRTVQIGPFPTEQLVISNRSKLIEVMRTLTKVEE